MGMQCTIKFSINERYWSASGDSVSDLANIEICFPGEVEGFK